MLALTIITPAYLQKPSKQSTTCVKSTWHITCNLFDAASKVKSELMLRVTREQSVDAVICRLEGRLTGEGAEYVRTLATQCHTDLRLIVDLTEVIFIDAVGEDTLWFLKRLGAQFIAETSYPRDACERLSLLLVCDHDVSKRSSNSSDEKRSPSTR